MEPSDAGAPTSDRPAPLFLLDAMSLAFRAYFALPAELATAAGATTNALHGFASMLVNLVRDHRPDGLAVAFDLPGDTFRHEIVEDYKGNRSETPTDLLPQFDMIREVLTALNVPQLGVPGYEADDVLATLATEARDRGCDAVVVTGDRDCFQLVEDPHIRVLYNRRGVSDYALYDEAGILERTGVPARRYPQLAALRGDPSDNLPGVPGVGDKTAAKLLATYGDLDAIFSHLGDLTPKLRAALADHEEQVRANAVASALVRTVPLEVGVDDLTLGGWDLETLKGVFEAYELRTLWRRTVPLLAEGLFGAPAQGSAPVARELEAGRAEAEGAGPAPGAPARGATAVVVPDVAVADLAEVDTARPSDPEAALVALRGLWPPRGGVVPTSLLSVAGRWSGTPGRAPLLGLALVDPAPPGAAVWLTGELVGIPAVAAALSALLGEAPVVGHGAKELLRSLLPVGVDCTGLVMDTEVAAYLLDPSTGDYGLAAVTGGWGDEAAGAPAQLPLDDGAGAPDDVRRAVAEALAVAASVPALLARLDAEGLRPLHDDVERPLVRVLARMEVVGIRVDVDELRRLGADLAAQTRALVAEVHRYAGHEFNVNSTPQLRAVLYDELKLSPGRKTKTGYSTDAATLESLRGAHPVVDALLRYRELEKLRSTYGESLLAEVAPDGRIHASFRQTVARTGRLSSERPNLHNIPTRTEVGQRFRRVFVPAPGWRFLVADYDQVELRVIAHLSGDPGLIAAFTSGQDIHRAVASGVYGVAPEEVTKEQRDRAKMVSYGLAYGMEAFGLARRLATGVEEAADIIERYFGAFPRVHRYMEETVAEARQRGYTVTALGRRRPLPDLSAGNYRVRQAAERQAMNAGIQGLAADLFKTALVALDRRLEEEELQGRLVLQIHDEVIVEAPGDEEEEVERLTRHALCNAVALSVPLEVSVAWGDSWAVKG